MPPLPLLVSPGRAAGSKARPPDGGRHEQQVETGQPGFATEEASWESLSIPLLLKRNKLLERENRRMRKELGLPKHQGEQGTGDSPFVVRRRAKLLEARVQEMEQERGALLSRALVAEEQVASLQAEMAQVMEGYEHRLAQAFDGQVAGMSRHARTNIILRKGKDEAAQRIQARLRGNQARQATKRRLMEDAITRVQAALRGNMGREQVALIRATQSWRAAQKRASLKKEEADRIALEAKRALTVDAEDESESDDTDDEDDRAIHFA